MKSLTNILRRSDITPYERVRMLIQNDLYIEKTGKDGLSESDLHVLTKGWNASNSEANQYNRYIKIIQLEDLMKMEAQVFLYKSEVSLLRNHRALEGFIHNLGKLKEIINQSFQKDIYTDDCIKFLIKNTYLGYEKTLHIFTFNNLQKEIQDDLILLDEEIPRDEKYIADEVFLYEIFNKNKILSKDDKDLIINCIYSRMFNDGIKKIRNSTSEKDGFLLHHFFAELPIIDIFYKLANDAHLIYDKENILSSVEEYANSKNTTIECLVKDKISLWLDNGLFTKEYQPIFISNQLNTWNGDTKNDHKKIFQTWYIELQKSKQYFEQLFNSGKLEKQNIEKSLFGIPRKVAIITGGSLYSCNEDIYFVKEYKKQIEMLIPISKMFLFIEKYARPVMNNNILCEFRNLAQNVSSIFNIDMTVKYTEFINSYQEEVLLLNHSLNRLLDESTEYLYKESFKYNIDISEKCLNFNFDDSSDIDDIIRKYSEEFEKLKI